MNISRSNYEIFFLDYLDGNLPPSRADEFLDFLNENPDLAEELKDLPAVGLKPDVAIGFDKKNELIKNPSSTDFDYRTVAYLEGDLTLPEQKQFLKEVDGSPEKRKSFDLMNRLRLPADKQILFPDKQSLKRKNTTRLFYIWTSRVAALLLLLFAIRVIWVSFQTEENHPMAQIDLPTTTPDEQIHDQPASAAIVKTDKLSHQEMLVAQNDEKTVRPSSLPDKTQPEMKPTIKEREAAPEPLTPIVGSLTVRQEATYLASIAVRTSRPTERISIDEYLAHKLINAPKGETFTFSNLAKASLHAAENISNNRLSVKTTSRGQIAELNFQSRLIAFSIPIRKNR